MQVLQDLAKALAQMSKRIDDEDEVIDGLSEKFYRQQKLTQDAEASADNWAVNYKALKIMNNDNKVRENAMRDMLEEMARLIRETRGCMAAEAQTMAFQNQRLEELEKRNKVLESKVRGQHYAIGNLKKKLCGPRNAGVNQVCTSNTYSSQAYTYLNPKDPVSAFRGFAIGGPDG